MTRARKVALGVAALLIAGGAAVLVLFPSEEPEGLPPGIVRATPKPSPPNDEPPKPAGRTRPIADEPKTELPPSHEPASGPSIARVRIPSLDVNAPMIKLGLNPDRTLQVPSSTTKTGWWSGGPFPGERGAAVVVGHVDSVSGPGVFYRLRELAQGDEVVFTETDGSRSRFVVTSSEQHPKNDFPTDKVYAETDRPTLRLVTCSGGFDESSGHYRQNLIVFAREA